MMRTLSRRACLTVSAASLFVLALVYVLTAPGSIPARAAAPNAGSIMAFRQAAIPIQARNAVLDFATRADLAIDSLVEVGRAPTPGFYRSAIVGQDQAGNVRVAFASQTVVTSFGEVRDLFRSSPVAIELATAGTTTALKQIDLTVVVEPPIARVELEVASGGVRDLDLSPWPVGGYSSGSVVATDPGEFPRAIRAYDMSGKLVAERSVGAGPVCPASNPDCID